MFRKRLMKEKLTETNSKADLCKNRIGLFLFSFVLVTALAVLVAPGRGIKAESTNEEKKLVLIDEKNFPDEVFRNYVSDNFDTDHDGILSSEEIFNATDVSVAFLGCKSLEGINYLTGLKKLFCFENSLTSLDLSNCKSLVELVCSGNALTNLNINKCSLLETLDCNDNEITELNIDNCKSLKNLSCVNNPLTSLDVNNCRSLEYLNCGGRGVLTSLNVKYCTSLIHLNCYCSALTEIDLSNCYKLEYLDCTYNKLTSLDVSCCPLLKTLYCTNNEISNLDISNHQSLETLGCTNNLLTSLDVSNCRMLANIYCGGNFLQNLDIRNNSSLVSLECFCNQLTSLDISNCSTLTNLDLYDNNLTCLEVSNCPSLTNLKCSNNNLTGLDVSACSSLITLDCNNNQLTYINLNKNLKCLYCESNKLLQLDISNSPRLTLALEEGKLSYPDTDFLDRYLWYIYINEEEYEIRFDKNVILIGKDNILSIVTQPENQTVNELERAIFSITAEGIKLSYFWEYKSVGSEDWKTWNCNGSNTIEVPYRVSRDGMSFRCKVVDAYGSFVVSNVVTLKYIDNPDISISDIYYSRPDPVVFPEELSLNEMIELLPSDDELEDPIGTNYYYYRQLTTVQKVIYWKLENIIGKSEYITIPGADILVNNDLDRAINAQRADNPLWGSYNDYGFSWGLDGNVFTAELADSLSPEYTDAEKFKQIEFNASKMLELISLSSDRETMIKDIISVVGSNVSYDYQAYMHMYFPSLNSVYSAKGFFLNGMCVCDGYAQGIKYLCDKLQIPCLYVQGNLKDDDPLFGSAEGVAHAWNYLQLEDDSWYLLDLSGVTLEDDRDIEGIQELLERKSQYTPYPFYNFTLPKLGESYDYKGTYYIPPDITMDYNAFDEEGFFKYIVNDDGLSCTITGYNGAQEGDLCIPNELDGYIVTKIGKLAFYFNTGFNGDIIIPDSVEIIDDYAFFRCNGILGTVHLPLQLKQIGMMAFASCTNLQGELNFPSKLEEIGICAFSEDTNLSGSLYLPDNLKYIGNSAFSECSNISGALVNGK